MYNPNCGKRYLFLRRKLLSNYLYCIIPALCKTWTCDKCRRVKSGIVRTFITTNFKDKPLWMLSITFFHTGDVLDTWKTIGKKCNRLLTYARKYSGQFDYLRVIEPHKDGQWPHIHILCTKPIATVKFVKLLTQWGFGWSFHSAPTDVRECAFYVSKYLTKEWPAGSADLNRIISKTRIVSCNRSLGSIFKKESVWDLIDYNRNPEHIEFIHTLIVHDLTKHKASFIRSSSFSTGFIITTDVLLPSSFIDEYYDPYIERICKDFDYEVYPAGEQLELPLTL